MKKAIFTGVLALFITGCEHINFEIDWQPFLKSVAESLQINR